MKTITIMDETLEHLEVLDLLTPCNNCGTYYDPDDRDTLRQLCPACQPVALEAQTVTREWLERNIYLGLGLDPENGRPLPIAANRIRDLVDHLYCNLAMMSQAQAQGIKPEPVVEYRTKAQTVICQLCGNSIGIRGWFYETCSRADAPRPGAEYDGRLGCHSITETQAVLLGLKKEA